MKRIVVLTILALSLFSVPVFAQMSDQAITSYIAQGVAAGKSKSQIASELLSKGVTASQAQRVISSYQNKGDEVDGNTLKYLTETDTLRNRSRVKAENDKSHEAAYPQTDRDKKPQKEIYGHNLFKNSTLTFEPNENIATPSNYVLGPGDEVIIDVWGVNENTIKAVVSAEGRIFISQVGPVVLSGLTIDQATKKIRSSLASIYSLSGADAQSQISVTLGKLRSIQVNVLGEVANPGTYRLSSLSSALNAVYRAGGVTEIGSLREIELIRKGKKLASIDIYDYIFNGKSADEMTLKDGDAVVVPAYGALAQAGEGFKRAIYYEVREGDSVADFLRYAGGFVSNASREAVMVRRLSANQGSVFTVKSADWGSFVLQDGDFVDAYLNEQEDLFSNRVTIKGAVLRPGQYELGGSIATVKQLIAQAGGLLDEAFTSRAQIIREKSDRSLELVALPIGAILEGKSSDVVLKKNDVVVIADDKEVNAKGALTINGYVRNPGEYEFAQGMTVEDLILLAGGLEDGASLARVDISRRIADVDATTPSDTLAQIFSFGISEYLTLGDMPSFVLEPYDIVSVRKSPSFIEQRKVRISGEVAFPGEYTLVTNSDRISDLFRRAGGGTGNAFVDGAVLKRKLTEAERNTRENMENMLRNGSNGKDSTMVDKVVVEDVYPVGISLSEALKTPGGKNDLILHDGDELVIPSATNTVRIQGEVLYPNAVNYVPGQRVSYYIEQAGGYSNSAKRSKVYVIYMNGKVAVGAGSRVAPGCEIVVPSRDNEKRITTPEWLAIGTSAASLTTMIATIVSLFVR